jgi:hypothetical protein
MAVWQCWKPKLYQSVFLEADHEIEADHAASRDAIMTFSGGVDSCFSLYRHVNKLCGRRNQNIRAGILVHGFDIPLDQADTFQWALTKCAEILYDVDIPLIPISTNWKESPIFRRLKWEDDHATATIAVLSLFQKEFGQGLIANTFPYTDVRLGSNPLSDPLLSSADFKIIHDGSAFTRVEKISAIAKWEVVNRNLRVCWEGPDLGKNCGVCEKCIRTILEFRVTGNGLPDCFNEDINDDQILNVFIKNAHMLEYYQSILDHAHARGLNNESWVQALKKRIKWFFNPPIDQQITRVARKLYGLRRRLVKPSR